MMVAPNPQTLNPEHAGFRHKDPWFYPLIACFLLAALLAARLLSDTDLGFHLRGGQWIYENHGLPTKDTYTYTVAGHDYLDIHWLYQVLLFLLYRLGGYVSLSLVNIGLAAFVLYLTYQRLRLTQTPLWIQVLLLVSVVFSCEFRFWVRPEMVSWLLMSLTLWVLEWRAQHKRDLLFLLPIIHLVWANVEGLFAIGWVLMAIYWISLFIQNRKSDTKLLKYSLVSVAACLLNPYFIRGFIYPFSHLLMLGTSNVFKQAITELQPAWTYGGSVFSAPTPYLLSYKLFSIIFLLFILFTIRKRKIHEILLGAVFFVISALAVRNIPLFLIVCAPLAAACWKDLDWYWVGKINHLFRTPIPAWIFTTLLFGFCLRVLTGVYYANDRSPEHFGLGLDREQQPVKACEFLAHNRLDGRIFNQLTFGGWLDWQGPRGKTFIDGRLEVMGNEFFSEYQGAFSPGGLQRLLEKYNADIVIIKPFTAHQWVRELHGIPDWRLVYLDGLVAVYLRKGYADSVPDLDYAGLLAEKRHFKLHRPGSVPHPPKGSPSAWNRFLGGFVEPAVYPEKLFSMGLFYTDHDQPEKAEPFFLEAIRRTKGRYTEFNLNLGTLYSATRRYTEAIFCLKQGLKGQSKNTDVGMIAGDARPHPQSAILHNGLGSVFLQLGRVEDAVPEFNAAIKLDPYLMTAYQGLWNIDEHMGKHDQAVMEMKAALGKDPEQRFESKQPRRELLFLEKIQGGRGGF